MSERATEQMSESFTVNQLPNRTIRHNGQEYLFFSGTAYLGLPQHPAFQQLMAESVNQYGTVFGSSRNGNLRLSVYEEAEAKLAAVVGAPSALTLSSGMMAGQVISNWLRSQNATFLYGSNAHPAMWHQPSVDLPTRSFADWSAQLADQVRSLTAAQTSLKPIAILVNSLDAVRSEYYDFNWIDALPDDVPLTLVVDDSHGIGVLNNGRGIWPSLPQKPNISVIVTASLAKAMGLPGGAIFGDSATLTAIRRTAFFGACSPMPPACLAAFLQADTLYTEGREQLSRNVALAEQFLGSTGLFQQADGYPVFYTEQDALYGYLLEKGIFIYSFAYPTAADRANTRIVISAFHTLEDIKRVAEGVNEFKRKGRKE
ncbi:aminotransferase class I/II-fold pyridoxal phosphate-dependent enzyme [Spirosoma sp. KNUC1025]|uniref:aminotransferase class I/II-fold pyridoxal phosphate-dependent enzyme n=1 Tax=Spirosoma sp. KNUC1025 TaxID=2894082 RepID=UPI0038700DFF|nr:aminotransferase class I/II-fold pyridoxal phosphate-dependent enzyme [Spirosoma sp. KNUC1025]